jgi:hypothetical protein
VCGKPDLRQYATVTAGFAYLAVPLIVSKDQAMAIARDQGGYLVCLPSPDRVEAVRKSLRTQRVASGNLHVGLLRTSDGGWEWASGEPAVDIPWASPANARRAETTGDACLNTQGHLFDADRTNHWGPFLIEWRVDAAAPMPATAPAPPPAPPGP